MTDIALAVEHILDAADYHDASSYERLAQTWKDRRRSVPTQVEIDTAWTAIQAERNQQTQKAEQRITNMAEVVGNKVDTVLTVIQNDLATLQGTTTNAQMVAILGRVLQRELKLYPAMRDTITTLAEQVGQEI